MTAPNANTIFDQAPPIIGNPNRNIYDNNKQLSNLPLDWATDATQLRDKGKLLFDIVRNKKVNEDLEQQIKKELFPGFLPAQYQDSVDHVDYFKKKANNHWV